MSFVSEIGALVASHSMGVEGSLKTFTVARTEAVLKLRASFPREGVAWVLPLVQAIRCLPGEMTVELRKIASGRTESLEFTVTGAASLDSTLTEKWAPELVGLLSDGLREVIPARRDFDLECMTQRLGACVNQLLATGPTQIELEVGGRGRHWRRRDDPDEGGQAEDPYASVAVLPTGGTATTLRLAVSRPRTLRARWRSLIGRGEDWALEASSMIQTRTLGVTGELPVFSVTQTWRPPRTIRMDGLGWFVPGDGEQLWLVREGVKTLDLAAVCEARGVSAPAGMIHAPGVLTTALGDAPRINEVFDAVLAWLEEARSGAQLTSDGGEEAWLVREVSHSFVTVGDFGRRLSFEDVERQVRRDGEVRFVWRHRARGGRSLGGHEVGVDLRVLCLSFSEVVGLRERLPANSVIPHSVVGRVPRRGSIRMEELRQTSLAPVPLVEDCEVIHRGGEGVVSLTAHIRAFISRKTSSADGEMFVTIFGREVVRLRGFDSGLVVAVELEPLDGVRLPNIAALREDQALLKDIHRRARRVLGEVTHHLMRCVLADPSPTALPWLRRQLEDVNASTLGLGYEANEGGFAALAWRPSPILEVPVGRDEAGVVTAEELLNRVARGEIIRPVKIVPGQAVHVQGLSTGRDAALVGILKSILPLTDLDYPLAAEAWALPTRWSPRLIERRLSREDVEAALATAPYDEHSRVRLLTHLLVSRAGGLEEFGLAKVRLFDRYDPLSRSPHSLVSLDEIAELSEGVPWVFPTSASRSLTRPVLCMTPGIAHFTGTITRVPRLVRGQTFRQDRRGKAEQKPASKNIAKLNRSTRGRRPVVTRGLDMSLAVGDLWIDGVDGEGIELWHGGLRAERVVLPGALSVVSGQVTVKTRVIPKDGSAREVLLGVLRREAEPLVDALATFRLLAPKDGDAGLLAEASWNAMLTARGDADSLALQRRLQATRDESSDLRGGAEERALREVARIGEDFPRGLWISKMLSRGFDIEPRSARFSKKLIEMGAPRHRDGKLTARLGLRHRWSRRVLGRGMSARERSSQPSAWELLVCTSLMIAELGRWPELARRSSLHRRGRVLTTMIALLSKRHASDLSRDKP